MKCLVFLALFVTLAHSQPPPPPPSERCTDTPTQWMGEFHESNHENTNPREPVIRTAYIFYDAANAQINITERELFEPRDRTSRVSEIYLHNQTPPMRYRVDLTTGQCTSERLEDPFRPFGIPSNATFHGIDYLGAMSTSLGILVDSFSSTRSDGGHYHGFWAPAYDPNSKACVPIIETYRNSRGPIPGRTNIHITFRNIRANPNFPADTFTIPAACRTPPPPRI